MSDYLGRLAARTIAPQSVAARPRIASAYETVSAPVVTTERTVPEERPAGQYPAAPPPRPGITQERPITVIKHETDLEPIATEMRTSRTHEADGDVLIPQPPPIERVEPIETRETHATTREHEHTIIERRQRVERLNVRRERVIERVVEAQAPRQAPIEITINRIDVHAAVAAPAEAPRPRRPAVMTLEEYVARRDGERR